MIDFDLYQDFLVFSETCLLQEGKKENYSGHFMDLLRHILFFWHHPGAMWGIGVICLLSVVPWVC